MCKQILEQEKIEIKEENNNDIDDEDKYLDN